MIVFKYHFKLLFISLLIPFYSYRSPGQINEKRREPLFSKLPSTQTGITFNNVVTDKKEHNILLYANYYGGAGIGVGDFNRDGLPDLYFAGNLVHDKLYLNKGDFSFEDISGKSQLENNGSWSSGVVVADVNSDGWDDVYITCELYDDKPLLRANKLYINNKDLTFTDRAMEWGIADTARTRHSTFLDYDRDGNLDLFLLNQPPNPGSYSKFNNTDLTDIKYSPRLYRNTGNRFEDVTEEAGLLKPGFPNSVAAADLDNDGFTDLYVANDFEAPDFFYHNNGDGTFTDILQDATGHTSFYSMGVDAADINNDGLLDLMVLDMVAEDNFRLKANMGGMDPEIFTNVVKNGGHYQYMFNTLQLNQGKNILSDIAQMAGIAATDWSWSNLIADFDNDGKKDIYITNGLLRDIRNTDSEREVAQYINKVITDYIIKNPNDPDITIWDILDLEEALKLVPSQKQSNYVYQNNGAYKFTRKMEDWGLNQKSFSNGSAYADLNNDGFLDLVVSNINEEAFVFKNNGVRENHFLRIKLKDVFNRSLFGTKVTLTAGGKEQFIETTNVRGMYSTSEQIVHFGLGPTDVVEKIRIVWPDQTTSELKNIKADQLIEVGKNDSGPTKTALSNKGIFQEQTATGLDFRHIENYFDDYQFQILLPHELSHFGPAMATADVNGDKRTDVYFGGASGQVGALYLQEESGNFVLADQQPWMQQSIMEDVDAVFLDTDLDGDLDLFVGSGGNEFDAGNDFYQDRIYVNDGDGNFQYSSTSLPSLKISTGTVLPLDFDLDGDVDLFIGERFIPRDYPSPASGYLLENQNGSYTDVTSSFAPGLNKIGLITDAASTDIDNNGRPDLVITGEWMSPVIFTNTTTGFQNKTIEYQLNDLTGWWFSVTTGDFDKDGDDDFIFGNLGLNYKYKATAEEPFEVYYNDFDGNGSKDIVLSYYNFGKKYPVRGRSCSAQQVPQLSEKFESYEIFASSGLDDIYTPTKLEDGLHIKATTFASIYVENKGNGKLSHTLLPKEAQFSIIQDAITGDFNNDGNLDLLYGGNLYVSEVETTRADAGIGGLLLGNGEGSFDYISPINSGIYIKKDIRKIRSITNHNEDRFLFVSNDDKVVVLKKTKQ